VHTAGRLRLVGVLPFPEVVGKIRPYPGRPRETGVDQRRPLVPENAQIRPLDRLLTTGPGSTLSIPLQVVGRVGPHRSVAGCMTMWVTTTALKTRPFRVGLSGLGVDDHGRETILVTRPLRCWM